MSLLPAAGARHTVMLCGQHSYVDWFSQYAFGGTNWDKTPVVATSTTDEPTAPGTAQPMTWLLLWAQGKTAPLGIWISQSLNPPEFRRTISTRVSSK